ncbi:unnamed protein product [Linum trigynum]|uniref:Uncharacterized protein n=1 Tax=Linum trigynum TaxID=586398 RepID=A0AAV2E564_9ROSI
MIAGSRLPLHHQVDGSPTEKEVKKKEPPPANEKEGGGASRPWEPLLPLGRLEPQALALGSLTDRASSQNKPISLGHTLAGEGRLAWLILGRTTWVVGFVE